MSEPLHDQASLYDQEEPDPHSPINSTQSFDITDDFRGELEPSCDLFPYNCSELLAFRLLQTK